MPDADTAPDLDEYMRAFYDHVDAVYEQWRKIQDVQTSLKSAIEPWKRNEPTSEKVELDSRGPIYYATTLAPFEKIDAMIASTGEMIGDFDELVQGMQSSFQEAVKFVEASGCELGEHMPAFEAAFADLEALVAQSATAEAAWKKGMGEFIPRYRKAKLELLDMTEQLRKRAIIR